KPVLASEVKHEQPSVPNAVGGGPLMKILVVDVGGTNVKIKLSGQEEVRKFASGPELTAREMIVGVRDLAKDWDYESVTVGYPGPVVHDAILKEPVNLGRGWM